MINGQHFFFKKKKKKLHNMTACIPFMNSNKTPDLKGIKKIRNFNYFQWRLIKMYHTQHNLFLLLSIQCELIVCILKAIRNEKSLFIINKCQRNDKISNNFSIQLRRNRNGKHLFNCIVVRCRVGDHIHKQCAKKKLFQKLQKISFYLIT